MTYNVLYKNKWLIPILFLTIAISFFPAIILPALLIFGLIFIYFFNYRLLLGIIITIYLSLSTEIFGESRIHINVLATGLLFWLFIKEFGLEFQKYPKVPKEIIIFFTLLLITLSISTIFSSDTIAGFYALLTMLVFYLICYMFYSFLKDEKNIYIYIFAIGISVLILSVQMFIDLYSLGFQDFVVRGFLKEKVKLYGKTGYTGAIILFISISFILAMFFLNYTKNGKTKFFLVLFFLINLSVIILANARAITIIALISISFILFQIRRTFFIKAFLILFFGIVALLFIVPGADDIIDFYYRTDTTNREIFWKAGFDIIQDNPVSGIGPSMFDKHFYNYAPSFIFSIPSWKEGNHTPHNFFIYYMAENGILGLILAISFFPLFFYFAIRTLRITKETNRNYFILALAILGIGIGFFIRSFVEVTGFLYYGYITTDLPFWLVFGILISLYQRYNIPNIKDGKNKFHEKNN